MYRFLLVVACLIVPCTMGASDCHNSKAGRSVTAAEKAPVRRGPVRDKDEVCEEEDAKRRGIFRAKDEPCEEEETHRKYAPGGRFYPDSEPTLRQKIERTRLAFEAAQVVMLKGKASRIDRRSERRCDRGHDRADELREEANCKLESVLEKVAND
jgi:hypothetical protein